MEMQFCLCGAQPGYPHKPDCPFPYYGRSGQIMGKWHREHKALQARIARNTTVSDGGDYAGQPHANR